MMKNIKEQAQTIHNMVKTRCKKFPYGAALEIAHRLAGAQSGNHYVDRVEAEQSRPQQHMQGEKWLLITEWDNSGVNWTTYDREDEAIQATCEDLGVAFEVQPDGSLSYNKEEYEKELSSSQHSGRLMHHEIVKIVGAPAQEPATQIDDEKRTLAIEAMQKAAEALEDAQNALEPHQPGTTEYNALITASDADNEAQAVKRGHTGAYAFEINQLRQAIHSLLSS